MVQARLRDQHISQSCFQAVRLKPGAQKAGARPIAFSQFKERKTAQSLAHNSLHVRGAEELGQDYRGKGGGVMFHCRVGRIGIRRPVASQVRD